MNTTTFEERKTYFNSNMVRLKEMDVWVYPSKYQDFNSNMVRLKVDFQKNMSVLDDHFNSNMVRLKEEIRTYGHTASKFQFQHGAIKRAWAQRRHNGSDHFNSNMVRLKV